MDQPEPPTPRLLQRTTFDTDGLPPEHRFEAWRALLGLTHEIGAQAAGFGARVASTSFGRMMASEMSATPQTVARSPKRVRDGLDHVVLHLTTADFQVEVGDSRVLVPAGAVTVNTLARPFRRSAAPERGAQILSLSRDLVTEVLPDPEMFHGRVLHGGFGLLLGEHMRTLVRHAHRVPTLDAERLSRATVQILAAGIEPTRHRDGGTRSSFDAAAAVRCRRFIDRHLRSADLTVDTICRQVGIARSTLYRLFADDGGVATYIRDRRLNAARLALASRERPRVAEVAHRYGFTNAGAFSRAFREAFGISPRDVEPSEVGRADEGRFLDRWIEMLRSGPS